jgi:SRSO17 transposase
MPRANARLRRLSAFAESMAASLGHADRRGPCIDYLHGVLLPGERKSMEPMAARLDPRRTMAKHQSLQHFVTDSPWDERRLLDAVRDYALPSLAACGGVRAWVVDDTGIPKKGTHSVGVSHQYCGASGKQDNCQVSVSISLANERMGLPVSWRLYLPESWAKDADRRKKAKVPESVVFRRKWEIALDEIDSLIAAGVPRAVVLADAGYGTITEFRQGLMARGLPYAVGVQPEQGVALVPQEAPSRWRVRPAAGSARALAVALPASAWKTVTWREGTRGPQTSRFAAVRVRHTHRARVTEPVRASEWLLIEWPPGETDPAKYALSSLPAGMDIRELIRLWKMRWRIERDFEELKGELGLDHFEGRSWAGFHHHGALCLAAFAFIAAERVRGFSPSRAAFLSPNKSPAAFRPRGSPTRTHHTGT